MEIHGRDTTLHVSDSAAVRDFIARSIKTRWPSSVLLQDRNDLFFHKDEKACQAWEDDGWSKANDDLMIHVIYCPNRITFVTGDEENSETGRIVNEITEAIKVQPCFF